MYLSIFPERTDTFVTAHSFAVSVTVPQHIPWTHWHICHSSFICPKCHCTLAHSLNTLTHLSHLGSSLKTLFWCTEGWCICSSSWVAITMYWLLWYMARWDKCVIVLWESCWKIVLCQWKIEFLWPGESYVLNIACSGVNELRQWSELRSSLSGFNFRTNKCTTCIYMY
jgi:hypothetical protein